MLSEKETLHRYLQNQREAVLWKLEGLSDRDVRWPMTPTGTNLLGLVKHLASVEFGYFGEVFDRPSGESLPWEAEDAPDNADMWATEEEPREFIVDLYRRAWAHADHTVEELELDAVGVVPWWSPEVRETTLRRVLVHMIAETARHAGHADILRELLDGAAGLRAGVSNLPDRDADWWREYVAELQRVAASFEGSGA
jgi:uncharacterized damage-inducible protein DinB